MDGFWGKAGEEMRYNPPEISGRNFCGYAFF